jgi:2-polyprenyl-3-methyl-5-hydroxy-6-metoxy-1,4-benzoquinol methylase
VPDRQYSEALWEAVPEGLRPERFELRLQFLLGEVSAGERILDVGCGEGQFAARLADAGAAVLAADVAQEPLRRAARRHPGLELHLLAAEADWDLPDAAFDAVWAGEVIEHVADTARWVSEVRRVLTPGGTLLVTTPAHGRLRLLLSGLEPFADPLGDHLHLYTARSLRTLLEEFGFGAITVDAAGGPPLLRRLLLARARR